MPTTRTIRLAALGALTLALASACSSDRVVTPLTGASCDAGRLRVGTMRGALNENSCVMSFHPWAATRSAYVTYAAELRSDKAYMLTLAPVGDPDRNGRNGLDPLLTVYGRTAIGGSAPVAVSDDIARDVSSELFFMPTRSATYRVQVAQHGDAYSYEDLGGYTLAFAECPVLSVRPDTGATTFELQSSDCFRTGGPQDDPRGMTYSFIRIDARPNEVLTIGVAATDFTPYIEAMAPGMDTHGYIDGNSYRWTGATPTEIPVGPDGGRVTLAIGARASSGPSRRFTFTLRRRFAAN